MRILRLMGIVWLISFQLVPIFLDTEIQIWNGITISQMPAFVKNGEWNFDAVEMILTMVSASRGDPLGGFAYSFYNFNFSLL